MESRLTGLRSQQQLVSVASTHLRATRLFACECPQLWSLPVATIWTSSMLRLGSTLTDHGIVANSSFTWILASARSISLRISQLDTNTMVAKAIRISRTQEAMRKQFHSKHCNGMLLFLIAHRNRRSPKIRSMIERRIHSMTLGVMEILYGPTNVHRESTAFVMIAIRNFTLARLARAVRIIAARNVTIIPSSRGSEDCRGSQLRSEPGNCACHWYDCEAQSYTEYGKLHHIARRNAEYSFYLLRSYLLVRGRSLSGDVKLGVVRVFDATLKW